MATPPRLTRKEVERRLGAAIAEERKALKVMDKITVGTGKEWEEGKKLLARLKRRVTRYRRMLAGRD